MNRIKLALLVLACVLIPVGIVCGVIPWEMLALGIAGAVSANQMTPRSGEDSRVKILAGNAETLYGGTLVFYGSDGYATATAGGNVFAGVLTENAVDNSTGSDGDEAGEVYIEGSFILKGSGFAQTDVGTDAYAIDNYTVTASSSGNSRIGVFTEYISSTKMRVKIEVGHPLY